MLIQHGFKITDDNYYEKVNGLLTCVSLISNDKIVIT
jgi:hypothetical protein